MIGEWEAFLGRTVAAGLRERMAPTSDVPDVPALVGEVVAAGYGLVTETLLRGTEAERIAAAEMYRDRLKVLSSRLLGLVGAGRLPS